MNNLKTSSRMKFFSPVILFLMVTAHIGTAQLVINFSAKEGYVDGPVHRQPEEGDEWREPRPGSFRVDAESGTLVFDSTAEKWSKTTYQKALGLGKTYIIAIDFQMTIGNPKIKNGNSILNRFSLDGNGGFASASIRQLGVRPNSFDLWLFINNGDQPRPNLRSAGFSGEVIGLELNEKGNAYKDGQSDNLRLIIMHRQTGEESKLTSVAALINVETGKEVQKVILPDWACPETWLKDAEKSFAISTGSMNENTTDNEVTSFAIQSVKIGVGQE